MTKYLGIILMSVLPPAHLLAEDLLFKEYSLKSGESISKLINDVKELENGDREKLIEESLRINRLSAGEATRLPIGMSVLIPVNVYSFHETKNKALVSKSDKLESTAVEEESVLDQDVDTVAETSYHKREEDVQVDTVNQKSSALQKISINVDEDNKNQKFFAKVGIENTNLNTEDSSRNGDVQSLSLGVATSVTDKLIVGVDVSKDLSAEEEDFISKKASVKLGGSYGLYSNGLAGIDINLSYESRSYNFTGLQIARLGEVTQASTMLGARGFYALSDTVSLTGTLDYAVSTSAENNVSSNNGLVLDSISRYSLEASVNYHYQNTQQLYFSVAKESNRWESDNREISYDSNLLKAGLIIAF